MKRYRLALFDMDYTILPYDSLVPFAGFVLRHEPWRIFYLGIFFPACGLYLVRLIGREGLKRAFLSILWRMKKEKVEVYAQDFVREIALPLVYKEIKSEIDDLKNSGTRLVLNSASPMFYVRYIASGAGFDQAIATDVVIEDRMPLLPRLIGKSNRGFEKLKNMPDIVSGDVMTHVQNAKPANPDDFNPPVLAETIGYSDSSADLPMLKLCEDAVLIHPSPSLAALGEKRGWRISLPVRPYSSNLEKYFRLSLCLLGVLRLK